MLTVFASCVGAFVASCAPDDSVRPKFLPPQVQVEVAVPDGCARFQVRFDAGGTPVVEPIYNTGSCATNELKLLSDTAATFDAVTGALRVAVVIENQGTLAVIPRVMLRFNADSALRRDANGEIVPGTSDILGYLPDSSDASGRIAFWWYDHLLAPSGQVQVLQPGARTQRRWVEFRGAGWTAQVRLKLFASGQGQPTVPVVAPDSVPYAYTSRIYSPPSGGWSYAEDLLMVRFKLGTSVAEKTRVIGLVAGIVVGGAKDARSDGGIYVVKVPSDTTQATLAAARITITAQSSVLSVWQYWFAPLRSTFLRPNDGGTWSTQSWRPRGDSLLAPSALRNSWGIQYARAPLAWGCATGLGSVIGFVDNGYRTTGTTDLPVTYRRSKGANLPTDTLRHGTQVLSVVAAVGDNGAGMTGLAWGAEFAFADPTYRDNAGRPVYDTLGHRVFAYWNALAEIDSLALAGASVINISLGADSTPILNLQDTVVANDVRGQLGSLAFNLTSPGRTPPLVVISSGNVPLGDPRRSVFPLLKDSLPNHTLVVAAMNRDSTLQRAPVGSAYIDIVAPGEEIGYVDDRGLSRNSGASFAAPIVTGTAGLIKSFDPRLTADSVRALVLAGAVRSGRRVGDYPVVDAYESLKLAAERTGAPLCGNRVFERSDSIFAQRNPTLSTASSDEFLGIYRGQSRALAVEHGGRSIVYHHWGGAADSALVYSPAGWTLQPRAPTIPNSGFARSQESSSHDGDTLVIGTYENANPPTYIDLFLANPQFTPISPTIRPPGGLANAFGYDPTRPRFLAATYAGAGPSSLYFFDFAGSVPVATSIGVTFANRAVWQIGISEDGSEAKALSMDAAPFLGTCFIDWISLRAGEVGQIKRTVVIPKNSVGNCWGDGAIANRIAGLPLQSPKAAGRRRAQGGRSG